MTRSCYVVILTNDILIVLWKTSIFTVNKYDKDGKFLAFLLK